MIKIKRTKSNFERETLKVPFGFKGEYIKELWQIAAFMESEKGNYGLGLGVQSVLWSDSDIFTEYGNLGGNNIMFLMTRFALKAATEIPYDTPIDLLDKLLPITHEYGKKISGNPNLRMTYTLNSLVPVDHAAWMLYSKENNISDFDNMLPLEYKNVLSYKNQKLANIPLITYGTSIEEIKSLLDEGYFLLKIKIGCDPDKDGDREKMLDWDKKRIQQIHEVAKDYHTQYTESGQLLYYLDANGRYDNKERLLKLIEYTQKINAFKNIIILEEPFPEEYHVDINDIPVRIAADESAHSDKDAADRIEMGYKAITLKPIAKTISMSLKIAKIAYEKKIPCFCADLTVNPIMADINKCVAARLSPIEGIKIGIIETNGSQYYSDWDMLKSFHSFNGADWIDSNNGIYNLNDDFYKTSGGIFEPSKHYLSLVE